jgi:hypothetical protein
MAEPNTSDLVTIIQSLATTVKSPRLLVAELQQDYRTESSALGGKGQYTGDHHQDRPPRFQKMDFPTYDGKTDPLVFLNWYESYFHQQRIINEERVWMASYNLDDVAQLWFIQIHQDEGTPSWHRFSELLNMRFGPPCVQTRSASLLHAAKRVRWWTTKTAFKLPCHARAISRRRNAFNSSLQASNRHSARRQDPQPPVLVCRHEPRQEDGTLGTNHSADHAATGHDILPTPWATQAPPTATTVPPNTTIT